MKLILYPEIIKFEIASKSGVWNKLYFLLVEFISGSSILDFNDKKSLESNIDIDNRETKDDGFDDIIRLHLGKENSEVLLNDFYPYLLLKTMLGNKFNFPENIDMSFAIPTINYPDFIKFKINLKTS